MTLRAILLAMIMLGATMNAQTKKLMWTHATTAPPSNICPNGDFDTGTTGWGAYSNVTISQNTTTKRTGTGSLQITQDAGATGTGAYYYYITDTDVGTFNLDCYVYTTRAGETFSLQLKTDGWSDIANSNGTALTQNNWTHVTCSGTAPGQAGFIIVLQTDSPDVSEITLVDDVQLVKN